MPPHIHSVETFGNWGGDAWFSTVACLFDAKAYHAVGGMDPNIFITNDFDLMFKLLKYGSISTTMEWITTVHCNPQSLARKMDAVTHAAIVAVNYRHENYDMAAKVMVRFADMRLKYMPIEEVLKIRPAEDFILIIKPRVLLKGLAIRILQIVKRRLRGH
jgi:hypothetical protein